MRTQDVRTGRHQGQKGEQGEEILVTRTGAVLRARESLFE
jgi:hypothetical protein